MEIISTYYYRKGKIGAQTIAYSIGSVLLVALGVFCFTRWNLDFLFTDWKGYVILGVYGIFTLAILYATFDSLLKLGKANHGIPAFSVGPDRFIVYDKHGLATSILFEDCEQVRFKTEIKYRGAQPTLKLIIHYRDKTDLSDTGNTRIEIPLDELDHTQRQIDRQLKKVYHNYKKEHES